MADMKKPKSGGKPKKITASGPAGGKYTPGERAKAGMSITEWSTKINEEHRKGTKRSR